LFFAVLTLLIGFTQGFASLCSWTAVALFAWSLYRARQELTTMVAAARRLDRNPPQALS
jgi:membrane protein required for beta-lactamase induction